MPVSLSSSDNYGTILLIVAIVIILGGLTILVLISKKSQPNTVLVIACVLYVASWMTQSIRIREVVLLTGAFRMLGFLGGAYGCWDLYRKNKKKKLAAAQVATQPPPQWPTPPPPSR